MKTVFLLLSFLYLAVGEIYCQNSNIEETQAVLRFGYSIDVFQEIKPADGNAALLIYANKLNDIVKEKYNIDINFEAKIYNSVDDIKNALKERKIDLLSVPADLYVELDKTFNLIPCLTPVVDNTKFSEFILIVRQDSNIHQVQDLKGKSLCLAAKIFPIITDAWIETILSKNSLLPIEKFFSEIKTIDKESEAVYSVFFRKSQAAVVRKNVFNALIELNPQLGKTIKILATSKPLVLSITAYRKGTEQNLLELVIDEASKLHLTKEGSRILSLFKTVKIDKIDESDIISVRQLLTDFSKIR